MGAWVSPPSRSQTFISRHRIGLAANPPSYSVALVSGAKLAQFTYKTTQAARNAFGHWAKGAGGKIPRNTDKAYDDLIKAPDDVLPKGFNPPKGLEKGSGKAGDKGSPDPPEKQPGKSNKDPTPTKKADKEPSKTQDRPQQTCKRKKRSPKGSDNESQGKSCFAILVDCLHSN